MQFSQPSRVAVLVSGGFDSAVLVGELARNCQHVHPIYIQAGLSWEGVELRYLRQYLQALKLPSLAPLTVLEMPTSDLYQGHWSMTGDGVPNASSRDEEVYLPGRNLVLLLKAMIWCHMQGVPQLALGVLKGNPFPDATPAFFRLFEEAVNQGIRGSVQIVRPFAELSKAEVVVRGQGLPLEWTFSCMQPVGDRHCGACNKCAERQRAFAQAGMRDPVRYAAEPD